MTLERIIRPFQKTDVFKSRRLPPDQPAVPEAPEIAQLIFEGSADSNYVEAPAPGFNGFTTKWEEDKSRRVTEEVRVENKDDPDQFLELERIKSTVFKNTRTGEEIPMKFDWSPA